MKKSRFTDGQILASLKQHEASVPGSELSCRRPRRTGVPRDHSAS